MKASNWATGVEIFTGAEGPSDAEVEAALERTKAKGKSKAKLPMLHLTPGWGATLASNF